MHLVRDDSWVRQGFTLLWSAEVLEQLVAPSDVFTVRELFQVSRSWPSELPHRGGTSLFAAGLDGILDALEPEDAETWLSDDVRPLLLSFQAEYEGQAGLVLWVPEGRSRIHMPRATEAYEWRCAPPFGPRAISLGRLLWSGAEGDVGRVMAEGETASDPDGPAWIGIHIRRVS